VSTADPQARRAAARIATLVAVPLALAVVALGLVRSGVFGGDPTGPVTMDAPVLDEATATICRAVVAKLPTTVLDAARRPVTAGSEQNAAYGEPPITLACGRPAATYAGTDQLYTLSGVCWFGQVDRDVATWTTVDRQVPIVVTVRGGADGSAQKVTPLSAAIATEDPTLDALPYGCTA
jgi:uncharacterized protein DUF3515